MMTIHSASCNNQQVKAVAQAARELRRGSGNLSANGLSRGCEVGSLRLASPASVADAANLEEVGGVLQWLKGRFRA